MMAIPSCTQNGYQSYWLITGAIHFSNTWQQIRCLKLDSSAVTASGMPLGTLRKRESHLRARDPHDFYVEPEGHAGTLARRYQLVAEGCQTVGSSGV
jgi:hypothetical protein